MALHRFRLKFEVLVQLPSLSCFWRSCICSSEMLSWRCGVSSWFRRGEPQKRLRCMTALKCSAPSTRRFTNFEPMLQLLHARRVLRCVLAQHASTCSRVSCLNLRDLQAYSRSCTTLVSYVQESDVKPEASVAVQKVSNIGTWMQQRQACNKQGQANENKCP